MQTKNLTDPQPPLKDVVMAKRIGLTVLSHIMRMSPTSDYDKLGNSMVDILVDLKAKREWLLGRKFLLYIATAANQNVEAAVMFVRILGKSEFLHWEWTFQGILALGTLVRTGLIPDIRSIALEKGLLRLVKYKEEQIDEQSAAVKIRSAAVIALIEAHQDYRGTSFGAIMIDAIAERLSCEESEIVRDYLCINLSSTTSINGGAGRSKPSLNQVIGDSGTRMRRISNLYKYTSRALAERHIENQSRHQYMERYVSQQKRNQKSTLSLVERDIESLEAMLKPTNTKSSRGMLRKNDKKPSGGKTQNVKKNPLDISSPKTFVLQSAKRQQPIPQQTLDYHNNYLISSNDSIDVKTKQGSVTEPLKISLLKNHNYHYPSQATQNSTGSRPSSVHKPARGTINRRKLVAAKLKKVSEDFVRRDQLPKIHA